MVLQLHLRRVGVEPRPDLVQGGPQPHVSNSHHEEQQRECDDHRSKDVGTSRNPSNIELQDDNPTNNDEQEVIDLLEGIEGSCTGPLRVDDGDDKDDPLGDDSEYSRGPSISNEAVHTVEPL